MLREATYQKKMSNFSSKDGNPMGGHSRVQQVLREARAMIGTVRPQTPTVPPGARLGSLGRTSSSSAFAGGRCELLGSPTGTPTPEIEMLVNTDREVKGVVARNTTVGQQWAQALHSLDIRVRHRAAANIFRHCQDELLDTALATITRTAPTINVALLKAEGALAALLVAARHPYAHETSAPLSDSALGSPSSPTLPSSPFDRVTKISVILAVAAETEGMQSALVTSGAIQTISELLPRLLESSQASATASAVVAVRPLEAILNLLNALRRLCQDYPHHILKVGLIDSLLKGFGIAQALSVTGTTETARPATSAGGTFASRFAFASSSSTSAATAHSSSPIATVNAISDTIVRILCQLSFDEDCLADFRLRKDNLTEPLLKLLERVEPLKDPLLSARLMLLISRIIDSQTDACEDLVSFHWDTVVSKIFDCLQKRHEIRKAAASFISSQGVINSRPPSGAAANASSSSIDAPQQLARTHSNASVPPEDNKTAPSGGAFEEAIASDAVIAALALLSNITLIEEGGYSLATSLPHMQCLISLINSDDANEDDRSEGSLSARNHTIVIRYTLVCLSNLSFYLPMMDDEDELKETLAVTLCLSVAGFLFEGDVEATLEATRILGNLSRTRECRRWMEENEAGDALVLFLGHEDTRLVYNCLGVLLNLTADEEESPSVCSNPDAVSLLLKHTQRLVSGNYPWELKELVQMLLKNIQSQDVRINGEPLADGTQELEDLADASQTDS